MKTGNEKREFVFRESREVCSAHLLLMQVWGPC